MTLARLLPLHIHGALEAALAPVLMAAPFVLGFEAPAAVVSVAIGALMLGAALATHADERPVLPISAHAALDSLFALVLAAGALIFGLDGDAVGGGFMGAVAIAFVLMLSLTRYSTAER
jgi:hypothetical protein